MADFVILANETGDFHPEEPEVDESFSLRFINLDGEISTSLLFPVFHDHIFSFNEIERERGCCPLQLVTIFTATLSAVFEP